MASSGITAVHFSTIRIEGSLVLLPGACGTIEASRDVQPLSARDWELPQGKSPLGVLNGLCHGSHRARPGDNHWGRICAALSPSSSLAPRKGRGDSNLCNNYRYSTV